MSIRLKIILLLSAGFMMILASIQTLNVMFIMPGFARVEDDLIEEELNRSHQALRAKLENLAALCGDWSVWDDTYRWIEDRNPEFMSSNLLPIEEKFQSPKVDAIVFVDANRKVIWHGAYDLEAEEPFECPEVLALVEKHQIKLYQDAGSTRKATGLVMTARGPMMVASTPILPGNGEGTSRGALIMGRLITPALVEKIREQIGESVSIWPLKGEPLPAEHQDRFRRVFAGEVVIERPGEDQIKAFGGERDLWGNPALLIGTEDVREVYEEGRRQAKLALVTAVAAAAVIMLAGWFALDFHVINPLARLTRHARNVGVANDLSARLNLKRSDELGVLANEFDRMVGRLDESRRQMLDTAHRSGMAEIATHVLHNVGNALNGVNVSAEVISESVSQARVDALSKAAALLNEHRADLPAFLANDKRGPKVVEYVLGIADQMAEQQKHTLAETEALREKVTHIKSIIASQQTLASAPRLTQKEDVHDLLKQTVRLYVDRIDRHGVQLVIDCPDMPPIVTDRSKFIQVISNLLSNALDSMRAKGGAGHRLTLAARPDDGHVVITVTDTGVGIAAQDLVKVFNSGFTTKPDGHGFGLHYCANASKELGGALAVTSAGPGSGATFTLRLAVAPAEVKA